MIRFVHKRGEEHYLSKPTDRAASIGETWKHVEGAENPQTAGHSETISPSDGQVLHSRPIVAQRPTCAACVGLNRARELTPWLEQRRDNA